MELQILEELGKANKAFQKKFPNKIVTRDFFRQHIKDNKVSFTESDYIRLYGNFSNLLEEAELYSPEAEGTPREKLNLAKISKGSNFPKRFFVSSLMAGASVEENFMQAIKNFCGVTKSELVLLAMKGVDTTTFDPDVLNDYEQYLATEYKFNKQLAAFDFLLSPQQILPLTGLSRFGQKEYSVIIAHPKQMLISVPTRKSHLAHLVMSTGTVSTPTYSYTRSGRLAAQDHILGGLVVEIAGKNLFFVRQVQWDGECFCDLTKRYTKDAVYPEIPEALILGDIHVGEQDDIALQASKDIIKATAVKKVFLHDIVSMRSVTHHEEHNLLAKHSRPEHQKTLRKELDYAGRWLTSWLGDISDGRDFIVVKSNHEEHLDRYLYEGRFVNDAENARLAAELFVHLLDEKNPVEVYLKQNFKHLGALKFLVRDECYEISGIECGSHGDLGNDGKRGTMYSSELNFGKSVIAHAHSPAIFRDVWRVGTNSKLKLAYTQGGSSWLQTDCLVFKNRSRQLITKVDGKWRI